MSQRYKVTVTVEANSPDDAIDEATDVLCFSPDEETLKEQGGTVEEVAP